MHYFNYLVFFLFSLHYASTLTFSESSTLPLSATHTPLSNLTPSSLLPQLFWQCNPPDIAPPLDDDDCYIALQRIPSYSEHARFHKGSGSALYKLPLSVSVAHCGITIDLIDHVNEEESSWDEVNDGAAALLIACVESRGGIGGNALVGESLLIRVTVQYIAEEVAGRSNNNNNNNSAILSSRTPSSSLVVASVLHCYPPGTGSAPSLHDCLEALGRISANPMSGLFHRGGADDRYRLPLKYDQQTCDIFIDLVDDVQEEMSNWSRVAWDTHTLIFRCVQAGAHLGGFILLGERSHIRVTVQYPLQVAGGNNNSETVLNDLGRRID